MLRLFKNPFVVLLICLGLTEVGTRVYSMYGDYPHASETRRNPTRIHAWPEYIRSHQDEEKPLAVLIGNSQGFGRDIPASGDLYFSKVVGRLSEAYPEWSWENWSSPGLRTIELELLVLQAIERGADLILFSLAYDNFDPAEKISLDWVNSDIHLLAGSPALWSGLPGTKTLTSADRDARLKRFFTLHSGMIRGRSAMTEYLSRFVPASSRKMALGREKSRSVRWFDPPEGEAVEGRPLKRLSLEEDRKREKFNVSEIEMKARMATFESVYPVLHERLRKEGIQTIWCWMPLAGKAFRPEVLKRVELFNRRAVSRIQDAGTEVYDFLDAVPETGFYTMSHFSPDGHAAYATNLIPILHDALQ